MGISYSAILAIGKLFDDHHEAEDFLRDSGYLENVTEQDIHDSGLEEHLPEELEGGSLNYYTDDGYYLGFTISCHSVEMFQLDFTEGTKRWDNMFPIVEGEIIHTVVVS